MELFLITHDTQLTLKKNGFLFEYCDFFFIATFASDSFFYFFIVMSLKKNSIKNTLEIIKQILPKSEEIS